MKENFFLLEKAIVSVGGENIWNNLPDKVKREVLFNYKCPAGGKSEENYHYDGSRYWEKERFRNFDK